MEPKDYKKLVDQKVDLFKAMSQVTGNHYRPGQSVFCPFHDNTKTPAASVYEDEDGLQTLFCFSEHKQYRSSDAVELLLHQNPYAVGKAIWNKMSPEDQEQWRLKNINTSYESTASSFDLNEEQDMSDLDAAFEKFRYTKLSFKELKQVIYKHKNSNDYK